jgi:hypothetical protein
MTKGVLAGTLFLGLLCVAGCASRSGSGADGIASGGGPGDSSKESERTVVAEKDAMYGSVAALRDAVEAAGYECTGWNVRPKATNAAEMAECDYTTVLMTYATDYDKQANLSYFEQSGGTLLVGPNWIVNGDPEMLDEVAPELGGTRWSRPGPAN